MQWDGIQYWSSKSKLIAFLLPFYRTGVFGEKENCDVDPAKYVVNDFYDAIKLIFKQEGLDCKLE